MHKTLHLSILAAVTLAMTLPLFSSEATAGEEGKKKIVLVAGPRSHGYGSHEHYAGCVLLGKWLEASMPNFACEVVRDGYPKDVSVFDGCDAVVFFADGGGRHPVMGHLEEIDKLADKGVGVAMLHYAVEVSKGEPGDCLLKWTGGYFEAHWSVNPHWRAKFNSFPKHPIARGVGPFEMDDEWYYHMRFRENMEGVTPILSDLPGPETLRRRDGAHSNNPHVRAAVLERKEPQHLAWASEAPNGQRGFGFTGGHWHWNWANPHLRRLLLNAIVWIAKGDIPEKGVPDKPVTFEDLLPDQDYPQPKNFNRDAIMERFNVTSGTSG